MSLSCSCEYYPEAGDIMWYMPDDYTTLTTATRKACCSCKTMIEKNAICLKFDRVKIADSDIEEKIHGEDGEIPRASWYMCESCSDLFYSFTELDFCIYPGDDMRTLPDQLKELRESEARWTERWAKN